MSELCTRNFSDSLVFIERPLVLLKALLLFCGVNSGTTGFVLSSLQVHRSLTLVVECASAFDDALCLVECSP